MMKSFFKKLSLVMALAMVVSLVAPAGSAFAAEAGIALQGTTTAVEAIDVEVGGEVVDLCFLGAPADWKTTYKWASADETIATVDKAGKVTGLKAGETTVTITAGADASYKYTVKVTVKAEEAEVGFVAEQTADDKLTLTFADKAITKDQLAAGLSTYFYVGDVKVNYPVFKVAEVKDGVAKIESYVLFTDGTTYGFTYGEESAEFTAVIGEVAYVTAAYACEGANYAAYVGKNTKVTATLYNEKGIDITKSAKGYVTYALVTESTNGDYWPAGATGEFYFNTAGVSAQVKVTYMTGKYDEMYNPIAGPDTTISLYSTNMPKYDIDPSQAPVATITTAAAGADVDWSKASTVIALNDDRNSTGTEKLIVKMKDNRGNKKVYTTDTTNGTFTFKSTDDSVLYVAADGTIMTNKAGDVSVLVYLTLNELNAQPKVVAVVPVSVKAAREGVTLDLNQTAAVVSTATGYNTTEFKFTVKDQLGSKINGVVEVWCNNANSLPTGAKKVPDASAVANPETGVYTISITGSNDNLPTDANGYTYTYTVRLNYWLTKTFSVTVRKPVEANGATTISGYKLEFAGATDIKTLGNSTTATVQALNTKATLYLLSNNVKYGTAALAEKPASIDQMKVGNYYYTIAKDGVVQNVATNDYIKTEGGKVVIDLTTIKADGVVDKKLGTGTYTIVVYKGEGTGETGVATASTFYQVTSGTVTVGDTQDTMSYIGRNGDNFVTTRDLATIVQTKFKFQIGNVTLDDATDYTNNNITVTVNANEVTNGSVIYINYVVFKKQVGQDGTKPVYVEYKVYVNDYVNVQ